MITHTTEYVIQERHIDPKNGGWFDTLEPYETHEQAKKEFKKMERWSDHSCRIIKRIKSEEKLNYRSPLKSEDSSDLGAPYL